jgi:pimeloyl-ACP methyl ester carboxylesterase
MILHYYERGERKNPSIVFIHGSASDASVWLNELNIVASKGYHCIALDLRGHGNTRHLIQPLEKVKLDIETHIHDVVVTLNHLNIKQPFTIVTHSFGGIVAINIAERYPQMVNKLILVCLPAKLIFPFKQFLNLLLGEPLYFIQAHLDFFKNTPLRPRYKSSITTNAHVLREIYKHVKSWNSFRKVPRLNQKIYFAAGRFDLVSPAHLIERLHHKTLFSKYTLFKWSSHALMEDEPQTFQKWLVDCIKDDLSDQHLIFGEGEAAA